MITAVDGIYGYLARGSGSHSNSCNTTNQMTKMVSKFTSTLTQVMPEMTSTCKFTSSNNTAISHYRLATDVPILSCCILFMLTGTQTPPKIFFDAGSQCDLLLTA